MTSGDDKLATLTGQAIHQAFGIYYTQYTAITQRAKDRFANRDWAGMQSDAGDRLELYKKVVDETVAAITEVLGPNSDDAALWAQTKVLYTGLVSKMDVWELAETFFNSITRRIFATVGVNPIIEFVDTCSRTQLLQVTDLPYRTYKQSQSTPALIHNILADYDFQVIYEDLTRDAQLVAEKIDDNLGEVEGWKPVRRVEMITSVFYRGKGAYLIGRISHGSEQFPLVIALLNKAAGIVVDAILLDENEVSILFSFTRSYFHVNSKKPLELIRFLKSIMPRKRVAELYISIGYNKHGKSELYCDLLQHLSSSQEKFKIAEGERGMVMEVFTMPDYDLVFKVIRDRFPSSKNTSREQVMAKYYLVFKHDRAGRLVDAQEFEHLRFERSRFSEELLEQLQTVAGKSVKIDDQYVVVTHAYVERRVTPLDIYLNGADYNRARAAVIDYGQAIKDLAASNIFPGDMLLKNFGVTRHGRIVFYDYDELSLLTDCNFRVMPPPRSHAEEISGEPWFGVGENDIFPEEFTYFLGLKEDLREIFMEKHADLFGVDFWHQVQASIAAGKIIEVFPYEQDRRLAPPQSSTFKG
jgi:isocitrate dehydrogenase kinase/phosphatase